MINGSQHSKDLDYSMRFQSKQKHRIVWRDYGKCALERNNFTRIEYRAIVLLELQVHRPNSVFIYVNLIQSQLSSIASNY